jgi:hypothetical protein
MCYLTRSARSPAIAPPFWGVQPAEQLLKSNWTRTTASTSVLFVVFIDSLNPLSLTCLAQGYTNPTVGTYMVGLTASSKAIDGYNAASDKPGSLETVMDYGTTDTDGLKVRIKLRILATPNEHRPQFEITEIRDYKGA